MNMKEFVSRAGEKLQFALRNFKIDVRDKVVADLGSSTGGFVDCLLQNGAKKVYSVDTSYGELAWKLRNDPRVVLMERTNAMHVKLTEKMEMIRVDTGWTRQEKILPNAFDNLKPDGLIICLIKPHYELGKTKVDDSEGEMVIKKVSLEVEKMGGKVIKVIESPIAGKRAGNKEFLALIKKL